MGRVNAAVEAQNVEIDGLSIRYLAAGEGPPLVLLHGAGDNSLDWRWVLPALARKHRVYAPDLPGSPDSARPAADYSPAFFERFAVGFLAALGKGRATLVGNSLGGLIALRLALSEPARVRALVLADSAGLGSAVHPARALAVDDCVPPAQLFRVDREASPTTISWPDATGADCTSSSSASPSKRRGCACAFGSEMRHRLSCCRLKKRRDCTASASVPSSLRCGSPFWPTGGS